MHPKKFIFFILLFIFIIGCKDNVYDNNATEKMTLQEFHDQMDDL